MQEVLERLQAAPRSAFQGDWLIGQGWDQNDWPEKALPHPRGAGCALAHHARWPCRAWTATRCGSTARRCAARASPVTRRTRQGGRILRGADGEPTGVLVDNAMDLVYAVMPPPTDEQFEAQLAAALRPLRAGGHDGRARRGHGPAHLRLLQALGRRGPAAAARLRDGGRHGRRTGRSTCEQGPFQGKKLTMRAVKLMMDGALGSRGAALHAPYSDEPGPAAACCCSAPEEYEARVRAFIGRGFQVATHAIGDRANTLVLDALLTRGGRRRACARAGTAWSTRR